MSKKAILIAIVIYAITVLAPTIGATLLSFQRKSEWVEAIKVGGTTLSSLTVVFTILLGYINYLRTYQNQLERNKWDKDNNTYKLLREYEADYLLKARDLVRPIVEQRKSISDEDLVAKIKSDTALEQSIIRLQNYFDGVLVALKLEIVNEKIIAYHLGEAIIEICTCIKPYINKGHDQERKDVEELKNRLRSIREKMGIE